jgi:hypothetical protein
MNHRHTLLILLLTGTAANAQAHGQEGSFGLELRKTANAQDVEMPLYPKAEVQRPASGGESGAVSLGLWSPGFGFRLAALKLTSEDGVPAVAQFYRAALAGHGTVLECAGTAEAPKASPRADPDALNCHEDKPAPGSLVLKVGRKKDFRVVAIHPRAAGTQIDLVRLRTRD